MYSYDNERQKVLTDEGQRMLFAMYDTADRCLSVAGCVRMDKLMAGLTGNGWTMLACADRLVELGRLVEIPNTQNSTAQARIFVRGATP